MRLGGKHPNSWLVRSIKANRVRFGAVMLVLYFVAILLLVWKFPDVSNLWVSIFVLASGFAGGLMSLGSLLVEAEEAVRDDGHDPR